MWWDHKCEITFWNYHNLNTLFLFPHQNISTSTSTPLPRLPKKMLRKTLYKKHAQVKIPNLTRSWKNAAANTLFCPPLLLQPYTATASFCYLVSFAHLLSLNALASEVPCCVLCIMLSSSLKVWNRRYRCF